MIPNSSLLAWVRDSLNLREAIEQGEKNREPESKLWNREGKESTKSRQSKKKDDQNLCSKEEKNLKKAEGETEERIMPKNFSDGRA